MYVDDEEWPMEGGRGNAIVRPNAPIGEATGLFIGTDPWLNTLWGVNFPCCGTIQFSIPGHGLTNRFKYNLIRQGCKTTSSKDCRVASVEEFLNIIENQAQYDALLGQRGYITYLAPIRSAKEPFIEECYFPNTKKYPGHLPFLMSFIKFENISEDEYYDYAMYRTTRIWWSGRIQFYNNNRVLGYTIWTEPDLDILENDIIEVDDILKRSIPYAKRMLAFVPSDGQYNIVRTFQGDLRSKGINGYVPR